MAIDSAAIVCVGDSALLKTSAGSFAVRVMHAREGARETHIGLQRTEDLSVSDAPRGSHCWWHHDSRLRMPVLSGRVATAATMLIAVTAAALFGSSLISQGHLTAMLRSGGAAAADGMSEKDLTEGETTVASAANRLTAVNDSTQELTLEAVRRMDRAKALLSPDMSTAIGLSAAQRSTIQGILDDTGKRLWQRMANPSDVAAPRRTKQCMTILSEMDQRVGKTLTQAQQAAWAAVNAGYSVGPTSAPTPPAAASSDVLPSNAIAPDAALSAPVPTDPSAVQ